MLGCAALLESKGDAQDHIAPALGRIEDAAAIGESALRRWTVC